jgi:hypothetical protein
VLNTGVCQKPSLAVGETPPTFVGDQAASLGHGSTGPALAEEAGGYRTLAVGDAQVPGVIYKR